MVDVDTDCISIVELTFEPVSTGRATSSGWTSNSRLVLLMFTKSSCGLLQRWPKTAWKTTAYSVGWACLVSHNLRSSLWPSQFLQRDIGPSWRSGVLYSQLRNCSIVLISLFGLFTPPKLVMLIPYWVTEACIFCHDHNIINRGYIRWNVTD